MQTYWASPIHTQIFGVHSLEIELEEKTKPIKIIQVRIVVAQQAHTYELTHDTKEEKYSVFYFKSEQI